MRNGAVGLKFLGRFGNQLFQYAFARAHAEQTGKVLHTERWIGQEIFQIDDPPLVGDEPVLRGYFQDQASIIYTREDARRWFRFRDGIGNMTRDERVVAHYRGGDYSGYGYVVVGKAAVRRAAAAAGFKESEIVWCEDNPKRDWLADFLTMMLAPVLFRANSTFSWWAGALGTGRVFAPVIEGLTGGREYDEVRFVEGNWPRCCELPGIENLHMREN